MSVLCDEGNTRVETPTVKKRSLGGPLKLGSLTLRSNLFLAPLAGYTDLAFRLCCREQGGVGMATTEIVSACALNRDARTTPRYLRTAPGDSPLAVQIDGSSAEELCEAARRLEDRGFAVVDVNMGCPVHKVTRKGGGSSWTRTPDQAAEAVGRMVDAVSIPITVKTRLGWDADQISAPALAAALEGVGIAALTIHGRTRAQGFSGEASLEGIREVVRAVDRLPIIGNGDVTSPERARRMLEFTGCAGVSIGRAALGDPWIFAATDHELRTGRLPEPPSLEDRVRLVRRHVDGLVEIFGERHGVIRFRKAGIRYSGALGVTKRYRRDVSFAKDREEVHRILDEVEAGCYARRNGRAAPSFHVRVPDGPVEKW